MLQLIASQFISRRGAEIAEVCFVSVFVRKTGVRREIKRGVDLSFRKIFMQRVDDVVVFSLCYGTGHL